MLKVKFSIYSLLLLLFQIGFSQAPSIEWQKCFGGLGSDIAYAINNTSDGGSIVCGIKENTDLWVLKLDALGNLMWDSTFGGTGLDYGYSIQQTNDNGYIIAGFTSSNNSGNVGMNHGGLDYWVVKLNSSGTLQWNKTFGGSGDDRISCIRQTTDNGYIVLGYTNSVDGDVSSSYGNNDLWLLKLDGSGNITWDRSYGGANNEISNFDGIIQTAEGGYIMTGTTLSIDGDLSTIANNGPAWVVKLTSDGDISWQGRYGTGYAGVQGKGICQTNDGGYAVYGETFSGLGHPAGNHGFSDYWVFKIDAVGNLLWQRSLGGTSLDQPHGILQSTDGGIVLMGWSTSNNGDVSSNYSGPDDFWLVKLSESGNLLWEKSMGGDLGEQAFGFCQTPNGGYLVTGYTKSNNFGDVGSNNSPGNNDYWVVKLASDLVVPVELLEFLAEKRNTDIYCTWKTAHEQNSHHFIVERSTDSQSYTNVGEVDAAGNSTLVKLYNFNDPGSANLPVDNLFYRLKMVDVDGSFLYSSTVRIPINNKIIFNVYPNPVTSQANAFYTSELDEKVIISIYDATGRKLSQSEQLVKKGNNMLQVETGFIPSGVYLITVEGRKKYSIKIHKI